MTKKVIIALTFVAAAIFSPVAGSAETERPIASDVATFQDITEVELISDNEAQEIRGKWFAPIATWAAKKAVGQAVCSDYTNRGYYCPEKPWWVPVPKAIWCSTTCAQPVY